MNLAWASNNDSKLEMTGIRKKKSIRLVFFRTGYIGDVLTCLPFVFYTIEKYKVELDEVVFIALQKTTGGVKCFDVFGSILGDNLNTHVLADYKTYNLRKILKEYSIDKSAQFVFLPLVKEPTKTVNLKKVIFFLSGVPMSSLKVMKGRNKLKSEYLYFFSNKLELNNGLDSLRRYFERNCDSKLPGEVLIDFKDSIVLHINSQFPIKMWPLYKFEALIRNLQDKKLSKFVLIGGQADRDVHSRVINSLPGVDIIDYTGKLTVNETICALKYAKVFIGCDGGPMHMAALAKCRVLAFFTQREEVLLWDPIITKFVSLRKDVSCGLCELAVCSNNICVSAISVTTAVNALEQLLEGNSYQLIEH